MKKLTEKELYDLAQEKSQESIDAYIGWLTATFGFSHDKFHWDDGPACAFRAGIRYGYRLAEKKILEEDMIDDVLNDLERLAYQKGRDQGLEEATKIIRMAPYGVLTLYDGTSEAHWNNESLELMARDILALRDKE